MTDYSVNGRRRIVITGIGVIAGGFSNSVNTTARLRENKIKGTTVAAVRELTCAVLECSDFTGFMANAIVPSK